MFTPGGLSLSLLPVLLKKKKLKNIKTLPHSPGPFLKTVIETLECTFSWMEQLNQSMCEQKRISKCKPLFWKHKISSLFFLLLTFAICIVFLQDYGKLIQRCLLVTERPGLTYWWSPKTSNKMQDGLFLYGSHEVLQQAALPAERRGIQDIIYRSLGSHDWVLTKWWGMMDIPFLREAFLERHLFFP